MNNGSGKFGTARVLVGGEHRDGHDRIGGVKLFRVTRVIELLNELQVWPILQVRLARHGNHTRDSLVQLMGLIAVCLAILHYSE